MLRTDLRQRQADSTDSKLSLFQGTVFLFSQDLSKTKGGDTDDFP
jgi:hypothetical protein